MEHIPVKISRGFDESQRRRVAEIMFEAFENKLINLTKTRETGVATLAEAIDPQMILTAVHDGQLLGAASLRYGGRRPVDIRFSRVARRLGLFRGLLACLIFRYILHDPPPDQILIEFLAVTGAARGMGVGTQLIDAVCNIARQGGFAAVSLDVIDANTRARQLYERVGFVVFKTYRLRLRYSRRLIGATAILSMVKKLRD